MKKKVIGIAAGLILLAAAGGYAGVGHYYASHFFPKTAINGLNCAGLTAEQVKEEIQKHIVDYTLSITERGGKTETLSGTEIGLTYVDDHAVEKLLESQNTLAWPAFYWKEKENQVAADSVYDKEMVQEKLQTMEGFQEEQQEAPTDAYLTDDGTSYVIVPETEGEQVDYEKAEQAVIEALDAGADDYLTKPFSVEELLARLRVTQRRLSLMTAEMFTASSVFVNGKLKVDYAGGCAYLDENELHLTPIEYKLLCLLSKNVGKVLTHTFITQNIWGRSWDNDVASLRVFMATLRKKLEPTEASPQYIQTHIGVGYRMIKIE